MLCIPFKHAVILVSKTNVDRIIHLQGFESDFSFLQAVFLFRCEFWISKDLRNNEMIHRSIRYLKSMISCIRWYKLRIIFSVKHLKYKPLIHGYLLAYIKTYRAKILFVSNCIKVLSVHASGDEWTYVHQRRTMLISHSGLACGN